MKALTNKDELDTLIKNNKEKHLFIFKHSTRCSISSMALNEFENFAKKHPEADCFYIDLLTFRDVSNYLSELSGVVHQSPQVFHYYNGKLKWNTSHSNITQQSLEKQLNGTPF